MVIDEFEINDGIECSYCMDTGEEFNGEKMVKCRCRKKSVDKMKREGIEDVDVTNKKTDRE